ncbi:MAG TPA: DNA translocase FtsK 4TM domain-containing protein, partial [Planctomycetaceae bacterium]|nr:DNA translocase FtsK 4TM domain-containing protein [Planctomycetaceae bacterium]
MNLQRLRTDLLALGLLAVLVFAGCSLVSFDPADPPNTSVWPANPQPTNLCGPMGAHLAYELRFLFGLGAYFLVASLLLLDLRLFARKPMSDTFWRSFGLVLLVAVCCVGCRMAGLPFNGGPAVGSGGYFGALGVHVLEQQFSQTGTAILLGTMLTAGLLLTTETFIFRVLGFFLLLPVRPFFGRRERNRETVRTASTIPTSDSDETDDATSAAATTTESETLSSENSTDDTPDEETSEVESTSTTTHAEPEDEDEEPELEEPAPVEVKPPPRPIRVNPPVSAPRTPAPRPEPRRPVEHPLPEPSLLDVAEAFPYEYLEKKARVAAAVLEKTFHEF